MAHLTYYHAVLNCQVREVDVSEQFLRRAPFHWGQISSDMYMWTAGSEIVARKAAHRQEPSQGSSAVSSQMRRNCGMNGINHC